MGIAEATVRGTLLLSVTLGSLALLGGVSTTQKLAAVLLLTIGLVAALHRATRPRASTAGTLLLAAFVGLTTLALLRYASDPLVAGAGSVYALQGGTLVVLGLFAWVALVKCRDDMAAGRLACAAFAPVVFVVLNLLLYARGLDFTGALDDDIVAGQSTMLGYAGISFDRITLPLAVGLNGGGAMGALSMVAGGVFAVLGGTRAVRLAGVAGVLAGFMVLLMVDSRGPILFAVLTLAALALFPRWSRRGLAWLPLLLPLAPVAITWLLAQLGSSAAAVSRQGTDALTATGRTEVWDAAFDFLGSPSIDHLYGYGTFGQTRTGLSLEYAHIFDTDNERFASLHNVVLQNILDIGYIGAGVFLALVAVGIYTAARRYEATGQPEALAALGLVIVLGLAGATEPIPSIFAPAALAAFVVASTAGIRRTGLVRDTAALRLPQLRYRRALPALAIGTWLALVVGTISLMQF